MSNPRAFLNGQEGGTIQAPALAPISINGKLLNNDGTLFPLSTGTTTLEIYDRQDRSDVASLSMAAAATVAADGSFVASATGLQFNLKPGQYYGYVKYAIAGVISFGGKPVTIIVF